MDGAGSLLQSRFLLPHCDKSTNLEYPAVVPVRTEQFPWGVKHEATRYDD